jgi:hypothetical protein
VLNSARWWSSRTCSAPAERETSFATPEENSYSIKFVGHPPVPKRYSCGTESDIFSIIAVPTTRGQGGRTLRPLRLLALRVG